MTATILDGKLLAQKLSEDLKVEIIRLKSSSGKTVNMVNVMVGDDHGASAYANSQKRIADRVGINYQLLALPVKTTQRQLEGELERLSQDVSVNAIMLHKPVPDGIDFQKAVRHIAVVKDVEGLNAANLGHLFLSGTQILPCTPAAVMEHLRAIPNFSLRGKEAVVVGRSEIVGKPVAMMLLAESATVTVCHSGTSQAGQLEQHIGQAEVLIAAIGQAKFIKGEWIKKGAVVIDVGINSIDDKIVGDVDFESAQTRAAYITPVPGGVGPVTVVCLMRNAVEAFKLQNK
ncbi:MAG: bifunctional 5,10-methylenetetrahydrofolate dehydrogenase/5,10-methenyltetrahydrofolate cyclohydrolase [Candidatus Omnitrophica bacterium]|nr:bifunctional 5,10-methylenetetrahydrofolate dehydrogenase/5,10-methenyltetrahydrofolate cyclohydrolase [Candidatus Omnitrophota bacterium]